MIRESTHAILVFIAVANCYWPAIRCGLAAYLLDGELYYQKAHEVDFYIHTENKKNGGGGHLPSVEALAP